MSYQPPPQGYAPGSAQYPGQNPAYPPQGQYAQPPQGQYAQPPQGQYAPPPQGQYAQPPQGQYAPPPQGQYAPPPQQYQQPPQGQYAPPPQGQYAPPPQGQYAPPPQQYAPPPQQYQQPPQGQYAPPPQQYQQPPQGQYAPPPQQYQQQPPPQQYQQPPQQQYQQQPPQQQYQQPPQAAPGAPPPQAAPGVPPPQAAVPPAAPVAQMEALSVQEPVTHGTITPTPGFDPEADAAALRKAMKGMGTDEKALIAVLAHRTAEERLKISRTFKTMYGKDLEKNIKSETSGRFEDLLVALLYDRPHFDARCLRKAMKGAGTDERALIEVICTRTNAEIAEINKAYTEMYKRDLEKDIVSETSGHFKRLLVSCVQGNRNESPHVDWDLAKKEAAELYAAGEKRWGTDESKFNQIIALRSYAQLRATFEEYRKVSKYDIVRTIDHEMSGNLKGAFKAVVMCVKDKPEYFAKRLHKAMAGMGTNDESLIRIIVSRSEVDLVEIKQKFFDNHQKSLAKRIAGDTSGDYKRLLVAIVGE